MMSAIIYEATIIKDVPKTVYSKREVNFSILVAGSIKNKEREALVFMLMKILDPQKKKIMKLINMNKPETLPKYKSFTSLYVT
mgnify:CR=1 FL=1